MTLEQGIELAQMAKAKNYALRAEAGKVQFVTVEYDAKGAATVTERTGWMGYDEAKQIMEEAGE